MGFYGIYKSPGPTSHDVIDELRKITKIKKIGHAGTLDPSAEGVLVVAIGKEYTKKIEKYTDSEKEYYAEIELGKISTTDDLEGEIEVIKDIDPPSEKEVKETLKKMEGIINQIPPVYSAIKVSGTRSYKLARKGEKPRLSPRSVVVKSIDLVSYNYPEISINVVTESGVYIRALARDLGRKLSTGGVLCKLIRTRVGDISLDRCFSLEEFKKKTPYLRSQG